MKTLDHLSSTDDSGHGDYEEVSPIDRDEPLGGQPDLRYPRLPSDTSSYDMPHHPRLASHSYPTSDLNYRQSHGRGPYPAGHRGSPPDISLESPRVSQALRPPHHSHHSPHVHSTQAPSPALYTSEHNSWDVTGANRSEHSRATPASWANGQDRTLPSLGSDRLRNYASSGLPLWGRTTPPEPPRSAGTSSPAYSFPTLNSPFYPPSSQSHSQYGASSASSSSGTYQSPSDELSGSIHPSRSHSGVVGQRGYDPSPPLASSYISRSASTYHQQAHHLPLLQPSHPESGNSSSTSSSNDTSAFWPRDQHSR